MKLDHFIRGISLCHAEPVDVEQTDIRLCIVLYSNESNLGSNPFAFTHLEGRAGRLELLAVQTISKADAAIAEPSLTVMRRKMSI